MTETVIFRDLPATFPSERQYRKHAAFGSILAHTVMLAAAVITPIIFGSNAPDFRLLTFVVRAVPPPGRPPTVALPPDTEAAPAGAARSEQRPASLVSPLSVPAELTTVVDAPVPFDESAVGVPGGMPGGELPSGLLRSLPALPALSSDASIPDLPMPPPPEVKIAEPTEQFPIRLGEFHPLKTVRAAPPSYPRTAKLARIQGTVLLELTLNETGEVDEVRVVSGHQLLAQAAVDCVRNWVYEPPKVNGKAVRVLIPVRLNFRLEL